MKKIIITIDGFSGTWKWTTARGVAKKLWYYHLDVWALYRAVTFYFLERQIFSDDVLKIISEFKNIDIWFEKGDVILNWNNIEKEIRKYYVSEKVVYFAQILEIRNFIKNVQKNIWKWGGVVVDSRDASIIFPNAELKIFLETDLDVKAERRWKEFNDKWEKVSLEDVKKSLKKRDLMDLKNTYRMYDSILVDTTVLTIDEQIDRVVLYANKIINNSSYDVLVVSNRFVDLDGCASAYAYSELLQKQWVFAIAWYEDPQIEAVFAFDKLWLELPNNWKSLNNKINKVILVDCSHVCHDNFVKPGKVIEVIDHRLVHDWRFFVNAKLQIESVWAVWTLIAERFKESKITPSEKTALLLYYTIVSHTIYFNTSVSTKRDKNMAEWLKNYCNPDEDFVWNMFVYKSKLKKPIYDFLFDEFVFVDRYKDNVAIIQLELVGVLDFLKKYRSDILATMKKLKKDRNIKYFLFSCIDLEKIDNNFVVIDEDSEDFFADILWVDFIDVDGYIHGYRKGILLRKEVWPKIDLVLL